MDYFTQPVMNCICLLSYMPEILAEESGNAIVYLPLEWLSDEAEKLQKQVFGCLKPDKSAHATK